MTNEQLKDLQERANLLYDEFINIEYNVDYEFYHFLDVMNKGCRILKTFETYEEGLEKVLELDLTQSQVQTPKKQVVKLKQYEKLDNKQRAIVDENKKNPKGRFKYQTFLTCDGSMLKTDLKFCDGFRLEGINSLIELGIIYIGDE